MSRLPRIYRDIAVRTGGLLLINVGYQAVGRAVGGEYYGVNIGAGLAEFGLTALLALGWGVADGRTRPVAVLVRMWAAVGGLIGGLAGVLALFRALVEGGVDASFPLLVFTGLVPMVAATVAAPALLGGAISRSRRSPEG
jgi:hypothetical protein